MVSKLLITMVSFRSLRIGLWDPLPNGLNGLQMGVTNYLTSHGARSSKYSSSHTFWGSVFGLWGVSKLTSLKPRCFGSFWKTTIGRVKILHNPTPGSSFRDLFWNFKWPFQGLSDLHLCDQEVTWKKLAMDDLQGTGKNTNKKKSRRQIQFRSLSPQVFLLNLGSLTTLYDGRSTYPPPFLRRLLRDRG